MRYPFNNPRLKSRRRELRVNQTEVEKLLWGKLRNRKLFGFKFYRQYSIGPYVIDFYCPSKKLGLELDGSQHMKIDAKMYDKVRKMYLESKDIQLLRFWNNEVMKNIEGVLEKIQQVVTHPNPSLKLREGNTPS